MSGPTLFNEDGEPLFTPERPGIVIMGDLLEYIQEMRNLYVDTQELYQVLQQNLSFIGSGSPKGVYANLAALQAAKPTGDSFIYLTTDNGNWYYWNGSTWTSGGVYQASQLANESVTNSKLGLASVSPSKTTFLTTGKNMFDKTTAIDGYYIYPSGTKAGNLEPSAGNMASDFIPVEANTVYSFTNNNFYAFYDVNKTFISSGGVASSATPTTVTSPANARYIRITVKTGLEGTTQLEKSSAVSAYETFRLLFKKLRIEDTTFTDQFKSIYMVTGANLFNKATITNDVAINGTTGALMTTNTTGFVTSDFIPIKANTNYSVMKARYVAYFNEGKQFISGIHNVPTTQFTTPANAKFMRFSWYPVADLITVDQQILNEGATPIPYEPYKEYIPSSYLDTTFSVSSIPKRSLPIDRMAFTKQTDNLFDKSVATLNKTISSTNGTLTNATDFAVTDYIPVTSEPYAVANARQIVYFNEMKGFISGSSPSPFDNVVFTPPSNAKYVRIAWYTVNKSLDTQMVNKGSSIKPYVDYGFRVDESVLPSNIGNAFDGLQINLPPTVYAIVGKEMNIYFDNILDRKFSDYDFNVTCTVGQQLASRYRLIATTPGTYDFTVTASRAGKDIVSGSCKIKVVAESVGTGVTKKAVVMGDSTTASGYAVTKLNDNFNNDPMDITLLGKRGTSPNVYEAIAGWTARYFRTKAEDPTITTSKNNFFNPAKSDFDFTYYMNQNGYTSVDYFFINLGINDTFSYTDDAMLKSKIDEFIADYDFFIASVKQFDPNIKIGVCITIPPNQSQDAFGKAYASGQTQHRYKINNAALVKRLIEKYKGQEANNIYLVPIEVNLDTRNNMGFDVEPINARNTTTVERATSNGGVHPAESGYWQIADVYHAFIKSFEV